MGVALVGLGMQIGYLENPLEDEILIGRRMQIGNSLSLLELVDVSGHWCTFVIPFLQKLLKSIDIGWIPYLCLQNDVILERNETFGFGLVI
jgi:hypothetical protein